MLLNIQHIVPLITTFYDLGWKANQGGNCVCESFAWHSKASPQRRLLYEEPGYFKYSNYAHQFCLLIGIAACWSDSQLERRYTSGFQRKQANPENIHESLCITNCRLVTVSVRFSTSKLAWNLPWNMNMQPKSVSIMTVSLPTMKKKRKRKRLSRAGRVSFEAVRERRQYGLRLAS